MVTNQTEFPLPTEVFEAVAKRPVRKREGVVGERNVVAERQLKALCDRAHDLVCSRLPG